MTKLIGLAVPISASQEPGKIFPNHREKSWEHTYVISDHGLSWGCHGAAEGGRVVCRGAGDIDLTQCLAQSDGLAGIVYMINGVCHQTANRLLYSAKAIVSKAKGYTISSSIYGDFGLGRWSQLDMCLRSHDDVPGYTQKDSSLDEAPVVFMHRPTLEGLEEHNSMSPLTNKYHDDDRRKALRDLIDERLGVDYDLEKRRQLLDIQLKSFEPQDSLVDAFERNELSAEDYFIELTTLTRRCFSEYEKILGQDDFLRLFDFLPHEVPPPGDPELFARAHGLPKLPRLPD